MTLRDVLETAKSLIENNTRYKVVFSPQELRRNDEILIDVGGISVKERFTGGYTLDIELIVSFASNNRLDAVELEELIIKTLNEPNYVFEGADHEIDGNMIMCFMRFIGREVVYYE